MHGQVPNPRGRETLMATNGNGYVWFPQGFDIVVAHKSGLDEAHEAGPRLLDVLDFTHFFFLNCGVRGPFLPVYWPRALHWSSAYTELIDSTVKIVGGSIVCLHFQCIEC